MVDGSGLENMCILTNSFEQMILRIKETMLLDYDSNHYLNRKSFLDRKFNNQNSVKELLNNINFPDYQAKYNYKSDDYNSIKRLLTFVFQLFT
jgi:hypothetical protein